jgi:hypothetical protein
VRDLPAIDGHAAVKFILPGQNVIGGNKLWFPRKERPHMPGSTTALGRAGTRNSAPVHIAFRQQYGKWNTFHVMRPAQLRLQSILCQ